MAPVGWFGISKTQKEERRRGAQWLLLVTMRGDRRNNGEIPPYWFLLYPPVLLPVSPVSSPLYPVLPEHFPVQPVSSPVSPVSTPISPPRFIAISSPSECGRPHIMIGFYWNHFSWSSLGWVQSHLEQETVKPFSHKQNHHECSETFALL